MARASPIQPNLPGSNVIHLGLAKRARLGRLRALDALAAPVLPGRPRHNVRQVLVQKVEHEAIDLFKLEQEGVVALGAVNRLERGVWDGGREFLLLGVGEEAVRLDAEDQRRLRNLRQGVEDGRRRRAGRRQAAPRHVVRVQLARNGNVAVCVEAPDEFLALVAQVGLRREVGRCALFFAVGRSDRGLGGCAGRQGRAAVELGVRHCHGRAEWRERVNGAGEVGGAANTRVGTRRARVLVAFVVDGEVLALWSQRARRSVDVLSPRWVGRVATEPRLERVAAAVREEGRHASCT